MDGKAGTICHGEGYISGRVGGLQDTTVGQRWMAHLGEGARGQDEA